MQQFNNKIEARGEFPGYRIAQHIYESTNTRVYRAVSEQGQKPVILKVLRPDYQHPVEFARYTQEYEILRGIDVPGVVKAYGLEPSRNTLLLVLEDFGGISLQQWLNEFRVGVAMYNFSQFYDVASKLVDAVDQIQNAGVIHKNINPANIVINSQTGELKLIDFGQATTLSREMPTLQSPQVLEGDLAYISPEQTGRMNRTVDYRADLYSLGVTLYEVLTGMRPFDSADPLELIHYHLAKMPVSPSGINPAIPQIISSIILKLLSKAPEDRYQSASGLKYDLDTCWRQWQVSGQIAGFQLGSHDLPIRFLIAEKLYGREQEIAMMLSAFERVMDGHTEIMLITGSLGIGKTAIINEIHKSIVRQRGFFIKGKFEEFSPNIPYSAFVQAFRDLVIQMMSASEVECETWRDKILDALGQNGQVIVDVIPELQRVIGPQPPVPQLSGTAAQNRFNTLFQKFIACFATGEHPLVIFFDDLQWADTSSLNLIELLMGETPGGYLLLLGTYRDADLSDSHPLRSAIGNIRNSEVGFNTISLAPLKMWDINQMIANTLNCSPEIASPLTKLVYQRTKGNPLYSHQFLKALYADGLITFNTEKCYWQCDLTRVNMMSLTEDVVEFLAIQLQKLPQETQAVLKLAAFIGTTFDVETLASAYQQPLAVTAADLRMALQEGFVIPQNHIYHFFNEEGRQIPIGMGTIIRSQRPNYRFVHDRLQQVAYSLVPEKDRASIHLQIGRFLQQNVSEQELDERLFEICGHLNAGWHLISDPLERVDLAALNLRAGRKAKTSVAYAVAENYLRTGEKLLPPDAWETCYELSLSLHSDLAELAYLSNDFEEVERCAGLVLDRAHPLLDRVKVYEILIQSSIASYQLKPALKLGLKVLGEFGIVFPENPGPEDLENMFREVNLELEGKSIADLESLPIMTDPESLAVMRILSSIGGTANFSAPSLFPLLVGRQLILSIQHGNTPTSIYAYASYGTLLCGVLDDIERGYKFGQLALRLLQRFDANEVFTRNYFQYYGFIHHWKHPLSETLSPLLEAYHAGLETGDFEFACYSVSYHLMNSYYAGRNLDELASEITFCRAAIDSHHQESSYNYCGTLLQAVLSLLDGPDQPGLIPDEPNDKNWEQDVQRQTRVYLETGEIPALHNLLLQKLILSYLFEDYTKASQYARQSEQYLDGVQGSMAVVLHYFYDSLVKLALVPDSPTDSQTVLLAQVAKNLDKLRRWAAKSPVNFRHKLELVEAERQRVIKKTLAAFEAYERAITFARENGFLQDEALALELTARFFLAWGKERIARLYLTEAKEAYQRWGARKKIAQLEQRYPNVLGVSTPSHITKPVVDIFNRGVGAEPSVEVPNLDLATVIKASQAIAVEIELAPLLKRMLQIILENAGAQRGVLLLEENGDWMVKAEGTVDSNEVELLQGEKIRDSLKIPTSLIAYVVQSHQNMVLDDAAAGQFSEDPYIRKNKVRSVLCLQLANRGKLNGILYLENNLIARAFTADRLELLNLLSAQMAISIDNAHLYGNLEAEVNKRTRQLEEINQELESFSYSVSHDLRAPLRSLQGFSQALLEDYGDQLNAEGRGFLQRIIEANVQMRLIIDSLLQLSRVTRQEMQLETIDLSEMARQIADRLHESQPERVIDWVIMPGVSVRGDSGLLWIVMENILGNAFKFTGKHERAKIEFGCLIQQGERVYYVRDDGAGFDMAYVNKLFNPFERLHTHSEFEGTGIGLATVRRIIQRHGGRIWAESIAHHGATFFFTLAASA